MDDEEFENPDLIIPPNIKIIDPETLSDEEKKSCKESSKRQVMNHLPMICHRNSTLNTQ